MEINGETFIDGAFGSSNPVVEAYSEAEQMNRDSGSKVALALSIGSGTVSRTSAGNFSRYIQILSLSKTLATSSENTHHTMEILATSRGLRYNRLSVDRGLEGIQFDDWKGGKKRDNKTFEQIREATNRYLERNDVQNEIRNLATILVETRRLRCGSSNWKLFCTGVT